MTFGDGVRYFARSRRFTGTGSFYKGAESASWVVFRAAQIKSATGNAGTYDGTRESVVNGRAAGGWRGR